MGPEGNKALLNEDPQARRAIFEEETGSYETKSAYIEAIAGDEHYFREEVAKNENIHIAEGDLDAIENVFVWEPEGEEAEKPLSDGAGKTPDGTTFAISEGGKAAVIRKPDGTKILVGEETILIKTPDGKTSRQEGEVDQKTLRNLVYGPKEEARIELIGGRVFRRMTDGTYFFKNGPERGIGEPLTPVQAKIFLEAFPIDELAKCMKAARTRAMKEEAEEEAEQKRLAEEATAKDIDAVKKRLENL